MKKVNLGVLVLSGILIVNLPSCVFGNEEHEQESTVDVDDSTMLSPVWHEILNAQKELNDIVASGDLETVHEAAFKVRDLSKELLKRTTDEDLSEEQINNVKATVERIAEVAAALDEYGDGGDQVNTEKYAKKMDKLIEFIGMQYDTLKSSLLYQEAGMDEHHEDENSSSSSDEDFWGEDVEQYKSIHDHSISHGGQLGMSGSLHIEFVAREEGDYRVYVTDYERNPVDLSKVAGYLIINPESAEPEKLALSVDESLQEYLWAKGKPRKEGETITASTEIEISGQEKIIQSFYVEINYSSREHQMEHEEKKDD